MMSTEDGFAGVRIERDGRAGGTLLATLGADVREHGGEASVRLRALAGERQCPSGGADRVAEAPGGAQHARERLVRERMLAMVLAQCARGALGRDEVPGGALGERDAAPGLDAGVARGVASRKAQRLSPARVLGERVADVARGLLGERPQQPSSAPHIALGPQPHGEVQGRPLV